MPTHDLTRSNGCAALMLLLAIVFWTACFAVIYPYAIYPLVLRLLVVVSPAKSSRVSSTRLPSVTIVISAFNENRFIREKLLNTLALQLPMTDVEIIVASDASTDGTDDIVREFAARDGRIRLVRQDQRRGKSAALNMAVAAAKGEIIAFSDANAMYEPDAVRELVEPFADPRVGYVVGAAHYADANGHLAAENEGVYWKIELFLKELESQFDSVVGGDGAIYATRQSLYRELRDDDISDFVNPLHVIAAGYRGMFNPNARCVEKAGETVSHEFRRKRRIVNRSWRAVRRYGASLLAVRHSRFLFMLFSHKIVRWYALPLVATAWLSGLPLLDRGAPYLWAWVLINVSLALAIAGVIFERNAWHTPRVVSIVHYFYTMNLAGILGIWDECRGIRHVTWDHIRKTPS